MYSENHPDIADYELLGIFSKVYDTAFPEIQIKVITKALLSPWIFRNLRKKQQNLYKTFFKKQTYDSEKTYTNYENFSEKIKSSFKKLHYKNQLFKNESNLKFTFSQQGNCR